METKTHNAPTTNIFTMIAWFIFIVVLVASIGVYVYEQYLTKNIKAQNAELSNTLEEFKHNTSIDHFVQLDARLKAANNIVNSHLAFSALLGLISSSTLKSVQFTDLRYAYDSAGAKTTLSLSGVAPDFSSVALQSDKFSSLAYFKDQNFGGLAIDLKGNVIFNFSSSVDLGVLKYQNVLSAAAVAPDISSSSPDNISN